MKNRDALNQLSYAPSFNPEKPTINNFLIEAAAKVIAYCPYLQDFFKKIFSAGSALGEAIDKPPTFTKPIANWGFNIFLSRWFESVMFKI